MGKEELLSETGFGLTPDPAAKLVEREKLMTRFAVARCYSLLGWPATIKLRKYYWKKVRRKETQRVERKRKQRKAKERIGINRYYT